MSRAFFSDLALGRLLGLSFVVSGLVMMTQDKVTWHQLFKPPPVPVAVIPLEQIDLSLALPLFYRASTVFLDVREARYYTYGHVAGALNLTAGQIASVPAEVWVRLKTAAVIVVYCNGIGCGLAYNMARELKKQGLTQVKVYPGGWPEWRSCRLPMTMSQAMKSEVLPQSE